MKIDQILIRSFKIVVATALSVFAMLIAIGEFKLVSHHSAISWHQHLSAILVIGLCLCAAYMLARKSTDPVAEVHCPRCRTLGGHLPAFDYRRSTGNLLFHFFGGFFLSVFYSGSRQKRFRCRECGESFYSHTPISRAYRILFLLFVAFIANYIWGDLSEIWNPNC